MNRIKHSIEEVIGHTPILELDGLEKQENIDAHILVKLESLNPFGSLKDRIAMSMIDALERDTDIQPGDTIVEFSSGNTVIGLAAIALKRGYKMIAYMVQATEERIKLLEAYGAVVRDMTQDEGVMEVMSSLPEDGDSAQALVELFKKRSEEEGIRYFLTIQSANEANREIQYRTTGQEILEDVDYVGVLIAGIGSGGSITGVSEALREKFPDLEEEEDGIYWAYPGRKDGNGAIYTGSAGVVYFYMELYNLTKEEEYLEIINKAADYIGANWRKAGEAGITMLRENGIFDDIGVIYNYYSGAASTGEGLITVYGLTKRQKDKDAVREITDFILANAKEDKDGLYWGVDCTMFHDAGTMIYLYHAADFLQDDKVKEAADRTADRIVANAIADPRGGYAWHSTLHGDVDRIPNFEGGTAGTGYALTVAYRHSKKETYKQAAIEAAKHLKAIAVKQGDGFLIPWHDVPGEEPIFYLANCHGPAGTSKLFYGLYQITKEKQYLNDIKGLFYGMRHLGAPEKMSEGYWNSVCVCCGTAGILQFLLNCGIVFDGTDFGREASDVAEIAAEILVGEQEKKIGGRIGVWPIAYERIKPKNVAPDFGYATGSAGIAAALLQMYQFKKKEIHFIRYIDDPYPTNLTLQ